MPRGKRLTPKKLANIYQALEDLKECPEYFNVFNSQEQVHIINTQRILDNAICKTFPDY